MNYRSSDGGGGVRSVYSINRIMSTRQKVDVDDVIILGDRRALIKTRRKGFV